MNNLSTLLGKALRIACKDMKDLLGDKMDRPYTWLYDLYITRAKLDNELSQSEWEPMDIQEELNRR